MISTSKIQLNFYDTTTTIFMSKTTTTFSIASDAQLAIIFPIYLKLTTSIFYDVKTKSKIFTPKLFLHSTREVVFIKLMVFFE